MPLPTLSSAGELPIGIHPTTLREVMAFFGTGNPQRVQVATRLARIHEIASSTGQLARFIVFGSFITSKPEPNDVDVFMLMEDSFDKSRLSGDAELLYEHETAQSCFGASVFWLRRLAAFEGEQATVEYWQVKRGGGRRGIVEIVERTP